MLAEVPCRLLVSHVNLPREESLKLILNAERPRVIQNDELSWRDLSKKLGEGQFHNVVISPGPGTPLHPADLGEWFPHNRNDHTMQTFSRADDI